MGFVIGSYGEVNFTTLGVVYGVLSSFFVALYGMYAFCVHRFLSVAVARCVLSCVSHPRLYSYVRKIIEVVDKDEQYELLRLI